MSHIEFHDADSQNYFNDQNYAASLAVIYQNYAPIISDMKKWVRDDKEAILPYQIRRKTARNIRDMTPSKPQELTYLNLKREDYIGRLEYGSTEEKWLYALMMMPLGHQITTLDQSLQDTDNREKEKMLGGHLVSRVNLYTHTMKMVLSTEKQLAAAETSNEKARIADNLIDRAAPTLNKTWFRVKDSSKLDDYHMGLEWSALAACVTGNHEGRGAILFEELSYQIAIESRPYYIDKFLDYCQKYNVSEDSILVKNTRKRKGTIAGNIASMRDKVNAMRL